MLRALQHRNFRLFFFGQGVSLIGTWMQQVAMIWLVYRLSQLGVPVTVGGLLQPDLPVSFWPRWRACSPTAGTCAGQFS